MADRKFTLDPLRRPSSGCTLTESIHEALAKPRTYAVIAPALVVLGAATTISAPMLLGPDRFIAFALAFAVFQYLHEFDLGLARLIDRRCSHANPDPILAGDLAITRSAVAALLVCCLIAIAPFSGWLLTLAGLSGVFFMLAIGPLAFYRATSNIYRFTVTALLVQFGMIVPRLFGLLLGGAMGCVVAIWLWYGCLAAALNGPDLRTAPVPSLRRMLSLVGTALPLFVYSNLWMFYLLTPRWCCALLTDATQAGLFAFGANLIFMAVGVIGSVVQVYYPRHLSNRNNAALLREMTAMFAAAALGVLLAIPFCRYGMIFVFPKFAGAFAATAAILSSAVPLVMCAWIMPLLIALATRPITEAVLTLGSAILGLVALLWAGEAGGGIVGQAWGCAVSGLELYAVLLVVLARHELMRPSHGVLLWSGAAGVILLAGLEWRILFL